MWLTIDLIESNFITQSFVSAEIMSQMTKKKPGTTPPAELPAE